MEYFEYVPTHPDEYYSYFIEQFETLSHMPGWTLLNILCKRWFDSFYAVQIIEALIVNTCFFYLFRKYTNHIFLCALLYGITGMIFTYNTEVMREAIAVAITGIGIYSYLQGRKCPFYISVLLAVMFHLSALIVLFFPLVRIKEIKLQTIIIAFIISFGLWLISDWFVMMLSHFLTGEANVILKIMFYSDYKNTLGGFLVNDVMRYFICYAGIFYIAGIQGPDNDKMDTYYVKYMGFYLIIATIICWLTGLFRFYNYTVIFALVMLTEFIYNFKSHAKNYLYLTKIFLIALYGYYCFNFYMRYKTNSERYHYEFFVPYTSIMDENVNVDYRYDMWYEAVTEYEKSTKNSRNY